MLNQRGFEGFGLVGPCAILSINPAARSITHESTILSREESEGYYQGGTAYERAAECGPSRRGARCRDRLRDIRQRRGGKTEASALYAGSEGTFGKGLWPHASGSSELRDGVRLSRYMMTAMNNKPTNYVFAHESGHMLFGWPDLYGVGDYCIMANRGSDANPVGINDVFRADQGWIELVDIDAASNARLSSTPDGAVYRLLNPARPTEYFLWSNLADQAEWSPIAGGGCWSGTSPVPSTQQSPRALATGGGASGWQPAAERHDLAEPRQRCIRPIQ